MIKLNKHIDALEATIDKIREKIEVLENKRIEIEDAAMDRDFTSAEERKLDKIDEQIEELEEEIENIEDAMDILKAYIV